MSEGAESSAIASGRSDRIQGNPNSDFDRRCRTRS
jgi:hypothetical protein